MSAEMCRLREMNIELLEALTKIVSTQKATIERLNLVGFKFTAQQLDDHETAKKAIAKAVECTPQPWAPAASSAAPEMLAVLQELQESASYWGEYDVPCGIVERINAAIAKATGETP